jgi:hypothetical protein
VANHIDYTQGTRILGLKNIRPEEVLLKFNLKFYFDVSAISLSYWKFEIQ